MKYLISYSYDKKLRAIVNSRAKIEVPTLRVNKTSVRHLSDEDLEQLPDTLLKEDECSIEGTLIINTIFKF